MARIRAAVPIPLAVDQGCFTEHEALAVIEQRAADIITVGLHETGGILGMKKVAAIPNEAGGQVMHQLLEGDILAPGLIDFENGHIAVPDRPGLGIVLDDDQVSRYHRLYQDQGPFFPY